MISYVYKYLRLVELSIRVNPSRDFARLAIKSKHFLSFALFSNVKHADVDHLSRC